VIRFFVDVNVFGVRTRVFGTLKAQKSFGGCFAIAGAFAPVASSVNGVIPTTKITFDHVFRFSFN
jgi:hypothetical protein